MTDLSGPVSRRKGAVARMPAVCPNGHAMDDGLFECPACGAYRPSMAGRDREQAEAIRRGGSPGTDHRTYGDDMCMCVYCEKARKS